MTIDAKKRFRPHQSAITTYLAQKCPTQTGIILYHHMGTGKSFTSTSIAINWGKDIVVLAPAMLHTQWKDDYIKQFHDTCPKVVSIESYESIWRFLDSHDDMAPEGKQWYANHTLMMDECHNIADWMNCRVDVTKRAMYMRRLMAFGRRVLLTGTPMYWSPRDLAFQVNIAAGRIVMPVDAVAFEREFFLTDRLKAVSNGWIRPIHDILQRMSSVVQSTILRLSMVSFKFGIIGTYAKLTRNNGPTFIQKFSQNVILPVQKLQNILLRLIEGVYIKGTSDWLLTPLSKALYKHTLKHDYDLIVGGIQDLSDVRIEGQLDLDAYRAFRNNAPVNEPETFRTIDWTLDNIQKYIKSGGDDSTSVRPDQVPHPGANATPDELSDYHGTRLFAILKKSPPEKQAQITKAIVLLKKAASNDFRSRETGEHLVRVRNILFEAGGKDHAHYFVNSIVVAIRRQVQIFIWQIQYIVLITCITLALWVSSMLFRDQHSLRYINSEKFEASVSPWISYHRPPETEMKGPMGWMDWIHNKMSRKQAPGRKRTVSKKDRAFPVVTVKDHIVPYSDGQTNLFVRYTMGKMDYHDYAALQLIKSPTQAGLESFDQTSRALYEQHGCNIGNVCRFQHSGQSEYHAYDQRHLRFDTVARIWKLTRGSSFADVSPKFEAVVKNTRAHMKENASSSNRHCVYSNYEFASRAMCAYAETVFGKECIRFIANDASDTVKDAILKKWYYVEDASQPLKLLFLDTRYTEGLSVLMTDVMHILDPCQSLAKEEQLKARVARLNSHVPGDNLTIYEYMAYCPRLKKALRSFLGWFQLRPEYFYGCMPLNFTQTVTPEYLVKHRLKNMDAMTQKLAKKLRTTAVEQYMPSENAPNGTGWNVPARCGKSHTCKVATPGFVNEWNAPTSCHTVNRPL